MATWEEARRCPKCEEAGQEAGVRHLPRAQGRLVRLMCPNPKCKWFKTYWSVQVRPDGSVPDPDTRPRSEGTVILPSDEDVERIQRNAQATLEGSLRPGTELRK